VEIHLEAVVDELGGGNRAYFEIHLEAVIE